MSRAEQVDIFWAGLRNNDGTPISGGLVYTYYAGTTTPLSLYTSQDKSASCTNPIVLNSEGRATAYGDGAYKFVLYDASGVLISTIDNVLYGKEELQGVWAGNSSGSSNAYVLTPSPSSTGFVNGQQFTFVANHTNSGASTLNVSSLGAKAIKRPDGTALSAGDITSGNIIDVTYDTGAGYFILNTSLTFTSITVSGTAYLTTISTSEILGAADIVVGPTGGATKLTLRSSNANILDITASGHVMPVTGGAVDLGDSSTHSFRNAYIDDTYTGSVGAVANARIDFDPAGLYQSFKTDGTTRMYIDTASLRPDVDKAFDLGSSTKRFSYAYVESVGAGTADKIQFDATGHTATVKTNNQSRWVYDADGHLVPYTSGAVNIGSASKGVGNITFHSGKKLVTGKSYSASNIGSAPVNYKTSTAINWNGISVASGSDQISLSGLNTQLSAIYSMINTLWNDFLTYSES